MGTEQVSAGTARGLWVSEGSCGSGGGFGRVVARRPRWSVAVVLAAQPQVEAGSEAAQGQLGDTRRGGRARCPLGGFAVPRGLSQSRGAGQGSAPAPLAHGWAELGCLGTGTWPLSPGG